MATFAEGREPTQARLLVKVLFVFLVLLFQSFSLSTGDDFQSVYLVRLDSCMPLSCSP